MLRVDLAVSWRVGRRAPVPMDAAAFALLEGIAEGGSLQAAARRAGLSYRHAWGLLNEWTRTLGRPLVLFERGRGTRLTAFGAGLLSARQSIDARLGPVLAQAAAEVAARLSAPEADAIRKLVVHASHDLALLRAKERLATAHGLALDIEVHGSRDCLEALLARRCDVAAYHTAPDETLAQTLRDLVPRGVPEPIVAFPLFRREQGLLTRPALRPPVRTLAELAASGARFINRQRGSGTRALFDRLLRQAGLRSTDVRGYQDEEFTHLAVAATVAGGGADAAFGIRAAAAQFGLDFVPLAVETYSIALREARVGEEAMRQLVDFLQGAETKAICSALPGYEAPGPSEPVRVGAPRRPGLRPGGRKR